jgi:photosynthetic reaction center cytochrome c subunit
VGTNGKVKQGLFASAARQVESKDLGMNRTTLQRAYWNPWCGTARGTLRLCAGLCAVGLALLTSGCERTVVVQHGFRGTSQNLVYKPAALVALKDLNQIPDPEDPADPDSPAAVDVFKNVQVLRDVSATELSRLMQALSTWIAPEEGCSYCHNPKKLSSDEKYTKVVARRMMQMTRQINTDWKAHVGNVGVTCWTCHRGQAVPSGDWFATPVPHGAPEMLGNHAGKNMPASNAGNSALPYDPLSVFLTTATDLRVQGQVPLAGENPHSIKQTEWTYSMMMYISKSLGVNCNYCHSTRAMGRWEESTPQRSTAWYGIRMVRTLNTNYLIPLAPKFPSYRLGPGGDGPKIGCMTCHKGTYKPLYGVSPLKDYRILEGVGKVPMQTEPPASAPAPTAAAAGHGAAPQHS